VRSRVSTAGGLRSGAKSRGRKARGRCIAVREAVYWGDIAAAGLLPFRPRARCCAGLLKAMLLRR